MPAKQSQKKPLPKKKSPSSKASSSSKPIHSDGKDPWELVFHYKKHIQKIYEFLEQEFGDVETPLHYKKDYELGIAVILSAQCTDERVNLATPALFEAFPSLESFAKAELYEIEHYIFSTGFYRNKAKSIQGFARMLLDSFQGELPRTLSEMTDLPGFGRKTANVVLSEVHGIVEGFVVDTHVNRLTWRLGLTRYKDPIRIEREIMEKVPKEYWNNLSLYLIFHGRKTCDARKPLCGECGLSRICPSFKTFSRSKSE